MIGAKKANAQPLHLIYSYDGEQPNPAPPPSPSPSPPADHDMVPVLDTDTVEDQYAVETAGDAAACGKLCLAASNCTHAVYNKGDCFLKSMRHNDDGNTMVPIASTGCTLLLKRLLKSDPTRTAPPSTATADTYATTNGGDGGSVSSRRAERFRSGSATGGTIAIVNSMYVADGKGLTVEATQYSVDGALLRTQTMVLPSNIEADGTQHLFKLYQNATATVLLRLRFVERAGGNAHRSTNLKTRARTLAWRLSTRKGKATAVSVLPMRSIRAEVCTLRVMTSSLAIPCHRRALTTGIGSQPPQTRSTSPLATLGAPSTRLQT